MEDWTLQKRIIILVFGVPIVSFLWAIILLKLADWTYDGWRNNNLKKKWAVCLIIGSFFVLTSLDQIFPGIFGY